VPPIVIDRRKNPSKKNLSNRQRFLERFRTKIRDSARKSIGDRSIKDDGDQEITVPADTDEPHFNHRQDSGDWDYVLPGNQDYQPGDTIDKPKKKSSKGRGSEGSEGGERLEDEFTFFLNYDEYLNIIFDDLELPDLIKASGNFIEAHKLSRAGFTTSGVPTNLNVERTAIAGLSRRIALKSPKLSRINELEALLENEEDAEKRTDIEEEISKLKILANSIGFLDNVDLRYNNFTRTPKPITQAVMFCIMDVSYSMGEQEKIIAKKFFLLLHLFLKRRYKNLDVVFVRHHNAAVECDETSFFTDRESGGTIVSSAYRLVDQIIKDRYPTDSWNIYVAQASDGDNASNDVDVAHDVMKNMMSMIQFMAYIEILARQGTLVFSSTTNMWDMLIELHQDDPKKIMMQQIYDEDDVINVFRKFFTRNNE